MQYFTEQEQAVQLFDKLAPVSREHRVIFIVVKEQKDVKPLLQDLATLLQRFPLQLKQNNLRIKGTRKNKAQSIIVVAENNEKQLAGVKESQIVYA
jgi:hypothetical protein